MSAIPHFKPNVAGVDIDHVNSVCSQALEDIFGGSPIFTNHLLRIFFDLEFVEKSTQLVSAAHAIFGEVHFRPTNQFIIHGRPNFSSGSFFRCDDGVGHLGEGNCDQPNGRGFRPHRATGDRIGSGNDGPAYERRWSQSSVERAFAFRCRDWDRARRDYESWSVVAWACGERFGRMTQCRELTAQVDHVSSFAVLIIDRIVSGAASKSEEIFKSSAPHSRQFGSFSNRDQSLFIVKNGEVSFNDGVNFRCWNSQDLHNVLWEINRKGHFLPSMAATPVPRNSFNGAALSQVRICDRCGRLKWLNRSFNVASLTHKGEGRDGCEELGSKSDFVFLPKDLFNHLQCKTIPFVAKLIKKWFNGGYNAKFFATGQYTRCGDFLNVHFVRESPRKAVVREAAAALGICQGNRLDLSLPKSSGIAFEQRDRIRPGQQPFSLGIFLLSLPSILPIWAVIYELLDYLRGEPNLRENVLKQVKATNGRKRHDARGVPRDKHGENKKGKFMFVNSDMKEAGFWFLGRRKSLIRITEFTEMKLAGCMQSRSVQLT
ncbi:hypothetical protein [Verrucomicrobium sp. BvORR034]|uniref:hypothetical protein n=1 Tax=Verrucomicrobium sp. BvORR034 TaxID=1396418 RepID=UPI000AB4C6B3|nr:hypothetical protein [Verrucomicrobium sp. BvORR034]